MTLYIYTTDPRFPDFEFDATLDETKERRYNATKRPVENVGNVADHIYREPFSVSTNGMVAVTPISPRNWQPVPSNDPAVLADAQKALEELADKRDLVTLVSDLYTGKVAITSLSISKAVADGRSFKASIGFTEIQIAVPETARVDPSRLKPKVQKRADSKGGQKASEQKQSEKVKKSKLKRAADFLRRG